MSLPKAQDRLQPALLDRLRDDEPTKQHEPAENRVLSRNRLREQAFNEAPATSGQAQGDGEPQSFEWIADADMRIGPVLEAVVNGRYYWVPWSRLSKVAIEAPTDLRDRVWMPASLMFSNGGEQVAFLPTRYAGSDLTDPLVALARKTEWSEPQPGLFVGNGQRMLATSAGDLALMDLRSITLGDGSD